jgi:hypothetical protein
MLELDIRKWEFDRRLNALDAELDAWTSDTTQIKQLRRHNSQVRAFAQMLATVRLSIEPTPEKPIDSLVDARERSKVVLASFRIWEFLRAKLAQRREPLFSPFLWLADEFAWLCYQPVYEQGLKEPPLVYLNGGYSPFTLTRHEQFQAESVPQELIRSRPLLEVMESLPFPVIGVPWYHIRNLADLPVLGHEIGHSVEADLGLTTAIGNAIDGAVADATRRIRWNKWGSEVFADLYGTIACGPAFVSALANFLSTEDQNVEPDEYPPIAVRVRFNVEILRALGYATDCEKLLNRWEPVFPVPADLSAFANDAPAVAIAMLDGINTGGKKIRDLIPFFAEYERARSLSSKVLAKGAVQHIEPFRALVAAYRFAYDDMLEKNDAATLTELLTRLDRVETAMQKALVPDLRAGERKRTQLELRAQAQANTRRAGVWLDALSKNTR